MTSLPVELQHTLAGAAAQDSARRTRGCARPIRLVGASQHVNPDTGELIDSYSSNTEIDGITWVRCGDRRAARCESCSHEYKGDAWHLIGSGLAGGKGVPETVTQHPADFVTLTAPSFGPVHGQRRGQPCRARRDKPLCPHGRPMWCNQRHRDTDRRLGEPLCPDCYDYEAQVLWQYHAPELWRRFSIALTRQLAHNAAMTVTEWRRHGKVSYSKVAEFQARGVIHFHAVIRIDGPTGPDSTPLLAIDTERLAAAITTAAALVTYIAAPEGRQPVRLRLGQQIDIQPIRHDADRDSRDGAIHPETVAAYTAKYLTKSTEDFGLETWVCTVADARLAGARPHAIRILETATEIANTGGPDYERLGECLATLGYRGHPITKTRTWSTTFKALRNARRTWRAQQAEHRHQPDPADARDIRSDTEELRDIETGIVIGNWRYAGRGCLDFPTAVSAVEAAARARERKRRHTPALLT